MQKSKRVQKGFTLLEMLLVIVEVVLIAINPTR
jgi:competence protein ComGC